MSDGLTDAQRRAIVAILAAHPGVERVVLYGSRARGAHRPASDVDLALFGDRLTLDDQARLAEALAGLTLPQTVDLVLFARLGSPELREHILRQGVEWYRA